MRKRLTKKQWRMRRRIRRFFRVSILTILTCSILIVAIKLANDWFKNRNNEMNQYEDSEFVLDGVTLSNGETIEAELLTPNEYSRPETKIHRINGIVIHYVGNPMTTAQNNRDYFEGLASTHATHASSNFVVGLDGEVIQCVPVNEVAYASNNRNDDTISIEVCHPKEDGKFNESTYESVVALTSYLCDMFELSEKDVIRHYDVTGKRCPLYYVEHEDAWKQFRKDVAELLKDIHEAKSQTQDDKTKDDDKNKSED